MSWAIAAGSGGTGEYMLLTNPIYVGSGAASDFDIEFEYKIIDPTTHARPFGRIGNFNSRVIMLANSNEIWFSGDSGSVAKFFPSNYDKTVFNKYRFNRVNQRIYFYLNDVFVSVVDLYDSLFISVILTQKSGSQERSAAELKYFKMSVNNVDVIHLDASASDHSYSPGEQPVLFDTIGTNHAAGVSFDLDNSMWVDTYLVDNVSEQVSLTLSTAEQLNQCSLLSVAQFKNIQLQAAEQLNTVNELTFNQNLTLSLSTAQQFNYSLLLSVNANDYFVLTESEQRNNSINLSTNVNNAFVLNTAEQLNESDLLAFNAPLFIQLLPAEQLNSAINLSTNVNNAFVLNAAEQLNESDLLAFNAPLFIQLLPAEQLNSAINLSTNVNNEFVLNTAELLNESDLLAFNAPLSIQLLPAEQLNSAINLSTNVNNEFVLNTAEQLNAANQLQLQQHLNLFLINAQQLNHASQLFIDNKLKSLGLVTAKIIQQTNSAVITNVSYTANIIQ